MTGKSDRPLYKKLFDAVVFVMFVASMGVCFGFGMYLGVLYAALFYGAVPS